MSVAHDRVGDAVQQRPAYRAQAPAADNYHAHTERLRLGVSSGSTDNGFPYLVRIEVVAYQLWSSEHGYRDMLLFNRVREIYLPRTRVSKPPRPSLVTQ